jgi:hypothetical protein
MVAIGKVANSCSYKERFDFFLKGENTLNPPKNCSHKYNLFIIKIFGDIWTSHLGLFLLVLSIFV